MPERQFFKSFASKDEKVSVDVFFIDTMPMLYFEYENGMGNPSSDYNFEDVGIDTSPGRATKQKKKEEEEEEEEDGDDDDDDPSDNYNSFFFGALFCTRPMENSGDECDPYRNAYAAGKLAQEFQSDV